MSTAPSTVLRKAQWRCIRKHQRPMVPQHRPNRANIDDPPFPRRAASHAASIDSERLARSSDRSRDRSRDSERCSGAAGPPLGSSRGCACNELALVPVSARSLPRVSTSGLKLALFFSFPSAGAVPGAVPCSRAASSTEAERSSRRSPPLSACCCSRAARS